MSSGCVYPVYMHQLYVSSGSPHIVPCMSLVFIGASLSEPHIDEKYMRESYMFVWYVRHPRAALYKTYRPHEILSDDKSAVKKNQLRATWTYPFESQNSSSWQSQLDLERDRTLRLAP